jgi:putative membrane protein
MLWLKAFHVIAVVTWFAGLFYLPRLYVYHADATDSGLGAAMLVAAPVYLSMEWLRIKLLLALLLIAYHGFCYKLMRDFAENRNTHNARWYRGFNEVPSLLLIAIVLLAVVKPS